jgi:hypothetical protein
VWCLKTMRCVVLATGARPAPGSLSGAVGGSRSGGLLGRRASKGGPVTIQISAKVARRAMFLDRPHEIRHGRPFLPSGRVFPKCFQLPCYRHAYYHITIFPNTKCSTTRRTPNTAQLRMSIISPHLYNSASATCFRQRPICTRHSGICSLHLHPHCSARRRLLPEGEVLRRVLSEFRGISETQIFLKLICGLK